MRKQEQEKEKEQEEIAIPEFNYVPKVAEPSAWARPLCGRYGGPLVFIGPRKLMQAQMATWVLLLFPQFLYFTGVSIGFDVLIARGKM